MQLAARAVCQASPTTILSRFDSTIWPSSMIWRRGARKSPPDCFKSAPTRVDVASANIFQALILVSAISLGPTLKLFNSLQNSPSEQNYKFPFRGAKWCLGVYDKDGCLPFVRVPSPIFQIPIDSLLFLLGCLPLCNAVRWCEFTENDGAQGVFCGEVHRTPHRIFLGGRSSPIAWFFCKGQNIFWRCLPRPRRVKVPRRLQTNVCILQRILNNTKSRNNYLKIKPLRI